MRFLQRGGRWMLAAVLVCAPLLAQKSSPSAKDSAKDLAKRVDQHYNHLHSLKAGFTESYSGLGVQRSESGTLLLAKPGRMRWDYNSPPGKAFVLDGKYAYFYTPGDPHVQRIKAKDLDDLRSPLQFLLGHTELQKELEHLSVAPAANGEFTLTGVPKGQENRIARVSITATPEGAITGIEIEETDGAITRFAFSGEKANAAIPASAFRFVAPAGVPIVDSAPPV